MTLRRRSPWPTSLVLAAAFAINYIDRGNLSVAAPLIRMEFGLDALQLGALFSAFFATYALMQVPAGQLAEKVNLKWLYAVAFTLWSLSSGITGLAKSYSMLVLLRMFLSLGESVSLPVTSKILASEFPEEQRGLANGIVDSGYKFGPALGTVIGGVFIAHHGWRPLFLYTGLGGLLWLIPWFATNRSSDGRLPSQQGSDSISNLTTSALTLRQILKARRAWGTFVGNCCGGYVWYLMVTWLPSYLVMELHIPLARMGVYSAVFFFATGVSSVASGLVSDWMIRSGWSASRVRIRFAVFGLLFSTFLFPAGFTSNSLRAFVFLLLACVSFGLYSSNIWAISQSIAGPLNIGRWSGVQNLIGNLGGVASPLITGWVVKKTGSFHWAFGVAAAVLVIGSATYGLVVKSLDPLAAPPRLRRRA
jgi:MFS transporter, ACS family, D-galactonate transporter